MQKTLIITGGGIGDIVCLIPLLRRLHKAGHRLTLLYRGTDPIHELLDDQGILESCLHLPKRSALVKFMLTHLRAFDESIVTHLSDGRLSRAIAALTSRKIIRSNASPIGPVQHEIVHYLQYVPGETGSVSGWMPTLHAGSTVRTIHSEYVMVQPFAGNGRTPYKQWGFESWCVLLNQLMDEFPMYTWVLVGERQEQSQFIYPDQTDRIIDLIGKTSLRELRSLAAYCTGYIGLDTGVMHLIAAYDRPTITIWGGSNEQRFGYHLIDADLHTVIQRKLPCHPCNDWMNPNQTRVSRPVDCPDFACIRSITPEHVLNSCRSIMPAWRTKNVLDRP